MTNANSALPETNVEALAQHLATEPKTVQLIDVREPQELEIASIPDFINLPLSQFPVWSETIHSQFDHEAETIVMCHLGMRSAQMCQWLIAQGFTNVKNLSGGIDAYSRRIDQSVPLY
ncbi:rhodanese-like domain-containing protein [cf. Phormidesmis sp. LEGE 11477]|uniref:rhodanese-like domain-containing protein n=1 Tax=cf. Phormidesmis sp. LEGE 11477 TaxID=1828680 RepID=UPI00187E6E5D|nr:rhodanese-like domain-containing protein [cf. Phormidesmis sp. LEGE 11477]MBE9062664.1 rhodanese [cf. Phormidesmis sp. LEGE 11477]